MKNWKKWIAGIVFCMILTGCGRSASPQGNNSAESDTTAGTRITEPEKTTAGIRTTDAIETTAPQPEETQSVTDSAAVTESAEIDGGSQITGSAGAMESGTEGGPAGGQTATLYIGTRAAGFSEYPMPYEGDLTPELLIQGIADLTGWNLTLAETVATGKGGMSVCLSNDSSLFAGPPDPQKDEFHVYSGEQLAEMILDSIQKTLQRGFTGAGGNPDLLDIYYFMEGEQPLELPDLGLSWPLDQPYQWKTPADE